MASEGVLVIDLTSEGESSPQPRRPSKRYKSTARRLTPDVSKARNPGKGTATAQAERGDHDVVQGAVAPTKKQKQEIQLGEGEDFQVVAEQGQVRLLLLWLWQRALLAPGKLKAGRLPASSGCTDNTTFDLLRLQCV